MKLSLKNIRLSLASFALEMDVELDGDVIAIFGPSGSGKTSALDLIAGLRTPQSAFIAIDGRVLENTATGESIRTRNRGIGYLPQDGALFPHLSVRANLAFGSKRANGSSSFSLEHVAEVLEISHLLNGGVGRISGGEKQRVSLARALLSQPRLLLLDEPLASLDESLKAKSLDLLKRVRAEFSMPMVYVSHSAEEIMGICDQVIFIQQGRLIRSGRPQDLFTTKNLPVVELK